MLISARKIIGKNVKLIRESLGLSQLNFSIVTGLSKGTIFNIESGKIGYNIDLIDKIIVFSGYSIHDLTNEIFKPDINLRDLLIKKYKGQPEYSNILKSKPEIGYAIKFKLLNSTFFNEPKEINQIRLFFKEFGWDYKGTSISNALKNMPEVIEITPHKTKGNTNVYTKK